MQDPAIRNVCRSVGEVRREEVCARDQRVLFIMRSVAASSRRISAARLESVAPGVYYVLEHM